MNDTEKFIRELRATTKAPIDSAFAEQVRRTALLELTPKTRAFDFPAWADHALNFALVCFCVAHLSFSAATVRTLRERAPEGPNAAKSVVGLQEQNYVGASCGSSKAANRCAPTKV